MYMLFSKVRLFGIYVPLHLYNMTILNNTVPSKIHLTKDKSKKVIFDYIIVIISRK